MSEEQIKPKKKRVNADGVVMTPKDELEVYLLYKQGRTFEEIQERVLKPDGSDWSLSKIRKLVYKFKKGYSPTVSGDQAYNKLMGIDLEADLKDFDAEKSMTRSFKIATRLLEKALEDAEAGYVIVDESKRQIPLKTIMETVEKAGRFWSLQRKTEKEHGKTNKVMTIDYREMAKIYMEAKEDGIKYNAKAHMKDIIETINRNEEEEAHLDSISEEFDNE